MVETATRKATFLGSVGLAQAHLPALYNNPPPPRPSGQGGSDNHGAAVNHRRLITTTEAYTSHPPVPGLGVRDGEGWGYKCNILGRVSGGVSHKAILLFMGSRATRELCSDQICRAFGVVYS